MKLIFASAVKFNGEFIPANTPIEMTKEEAKAFEGQAGWVIAEDKKEVKVETEEVKEVKKETKSTSKK